MHVHDPLIHAPLIQQDLCKLAGAMHVISRGDECGGEVCWVHPVFTHNLSDGSHFHACFRMWPCDGVTLRRAGTEWAHRNHVSGFELKSIGRRLFQDKRVTDRLKQVVHDELEYIRNPLLSDAGEFQARVAFEPLRIATV